MKDRRKYFIVFLLTLSTLCYNLPYLSSTFYTQFLEAFHLSNQQAGMLLTMFSFTATPGYLLGGILADRFSPKKLVVISQLLTAGLGILMTFAPNYTVLIGCYLGFGVSTTFIHWSAYLKLVRAQADENEEGKMFGFFEMCAAIVGAIMSYGVLAALSQFAESMGFRYVTTIFAVVIAIVAILIMVLVKDVKGLESNDDFKFSMLGRALAHPVTWLNGFIVMGLFIVISGATYLNPFLSGLFGVSVTFSTAFAIANRSVVRIILSPLGGLLLDKCRTPKFLILVCIAIGITIVGLLFVPHQESSKTIAVILSIVLISVIALGRSGLYTPIPEAKVPFEITGTSMGIASAVGYSTDLWLYNLCGKWLDTKGADGYNNIFILLIVGLGIVVVCAVLLHVYEKKNHCFESERAVM